MRTDEHDGSSQGVTWYDLSKVPRPLYAPSLRCWAAPTPSEWLITVGNDHFQTVVGKTVHGPVANSMVGEVRSVLRSHRLLANTLNDLDHLLLS